jgi:hypothetical protein
MFSTDPNRIGLLGKPPAVKQFLSYKSQYNHNYCINLKPKGQKQLGQLMWRILNAENQVLKYTNICSWEKSGGFKKSLLLLKIRRI